MHVGNSGQSPCIPRLGICTYIFVMFGTFHNEMQYIFLVRNFIFMVFLAVKIRQCKLVFVCGCHKISYI